MMTDAELERLNRLVEDELKAGRSPAQALEPLQKVLENSVIRTDDLVFDAWQSTEPLPGHILACNDSSVLSTSVSNVYPALSGCGPHYNGMYGDREMLRDKTAAIHIQKGNRPAASIAEQVVLCLRVMGTSQVSLMPELAAATRRHLSAIMLKYPVLMHPALLVPVIRGGGREYVSLASALSQTAHGALPRYSHFRSREQDKASGVDQGLVAQLTAFAKHPCVRLIFGRAAHRVRADLAGKSSRDRQVKMGKESLVRSVLGVTGPRVEFLASVMELDELAGTPVNGPVRPFWASVDGEEHLLSQLDAMLAASIAAASGLVHVAAMQGTLPDSMRAYSPDTNFLLAIRNRHDHLFGPVPVESAIGQTLLKSAQRRLFLGRQDSLAPAELAHNVRNMALALTYIGFCGSAREAGEFLLESCVGALRPDGNLPRVDATCAVAFLKAIDELGGLGESDEAIIATAERVKASATQENRPFSDAWAKAAEVFGTERVMLSVINRASAEAKLGAPVAAEGADAAPARRRARAAV
jgi:hypothetical protein